MSEIGGEWRPHIGDSDQFLRLTFAGELASAHDPELIFEAYQKALRWAMLAVTRSPNDPTGADDPAAWNAAAELYTICKHLNADDEQQVMFAARNLHEWVARVWGRGQS